VYPGRGGGHSCPVCGEPQPDIIDQHIEPDPEQLTIGVPVTLGEPVVSQSEPFPLLDDGLPQFEPIFNADDAHIADFGPAVLTIIDADPRSERKYLDANGEPLKPEYDGIPLGLPPGYRIPGTH
jgi:hypothetical protein